MNQTPLPSLAALRAFEAAARLGSFQSAATALRLTPSAISHQIKTLEHDFGQTLFTRQNRRVALTDAGRILQSFVSRGFEELRRGTAALRRDSHASVLRVSAVPSFASLFLVPRLEAFEAANPGFTLKLDASQDLVNFDLDPVDVAIRLGTGVTANLYSELLLSFVSAPVCAPALAAKISSVADLARVTRIAIKQDPRGWAAWLRATNSAEPAVKREIQFDGLTAALQAAIDGLGVIMAPLPLVAHQLQTGRLKAPFAHVLKSKQAYRLVCRRGEEDLAKVARFRKWLKRELHSAALTTAA